MSRRALLPAATDAVPLVDLRLLGAPLCPYAAVVQRLVVNGDAVALLRPCVAVFDTGTTGLSVSDTLCNDDELPMAGAAMRTVSLDFATERGRTVTLEAAASRRRRPGSNPAAGPPPSPHPGPLQSPLPPPDRFPLIVTEVHVPWFDPGYKYGGRKGSAALLARRAAEAEAVALAAAEGEETEKAPREAREGAPITRAPEDSGGGRVVAKSMPPQTPAAVALVGTSSASSSSLDAAAAAAATTTTGLSPIAASSSPFPLLLPQQAQQPPPWARELALGEAPHVLFVGLAFLSSLRTLTIDVDAHRAAFTPRLDL